MLYFTLTIPSAYSKPFKRRARRYWAGEGEKVGRLLRFDRRQTVAQIRDAYRRRYGGAAPDGHSLDEYLAYALFRLAEHGFVRIEPARPFAGGELAPLAFRLAAPWGTAVAGEAGPVCAPGIVRALAAGQPAPLAEITAVVQRDSNPNGRPAAVAHCLLQLAAAGLVELWQNAG